MIKKLISSTVAIVAALNLQAQVNFSGTWAEPSLEMISGIQYSNAVPTKIVVTQTKDSIRLESTSTGSEGDETITETFALNGKPISRVGKTSKRTFTNTATWSTDKKTLTIVSTFSYPEKPSEIEFRNTETWVLDDNSMLIITKNSDAAVTDDWTIKATYSKQ